MNHPLPVGLGESLRHLQTDVDDLRLGQHGPRVMR